MAGIGFRLHRLAADGSYARAATAYLSSAVISAGPWLSAVISLTILGSASAAFLGAAERELLFATIAYAFAASLLLTSGLQLIVTRYLADRLYVRDLAAVAPTCSGVLCCALPLALPAMPFALFAPFELRYRLLAVSLYLTLALTWLIVVFLSATRDYVRILLTYLAGYALSLAAALGLARAFGLLGGLAGFTAGQVLCLALLVTYVYAEFPAGGAVSFAFLGYLRRYWELGLIGLLYSAGLWADNVLYWLGADGHVVGGFYRVFPAYDQAKLLGYMTTIPAAAVFLVNLETGFYRQYRRFYRLLDERGTLGEITAAKAAMRAASWSGLRVLLKLQALVTIAALLFAGDILRLARLAPGEAHLFRVTALGAGAQFLMFTAALQLLYLDARRAALLTVASFALTNAMLSLLLLPFGRTCYGLGLLAGALLATGVALRLLHARLGDLEYRTFMLQPIGAAAPAPARA